MVKNSGIKSIPDSELDHIFEGFEFGIKPRRHQLVSILFHLENELGRTIFPHGIGTGKTLTALWSAKLSNVKRILVVCPGSGFAAWKRDISKYTDFSYHILKGSGKERQDITENTDYDIYIINYEGLKTLYSKLEYKYVCLKCEAEVDKECYEHCACPNCNYEEIKRVGLGWQIKYKWFVDAFDCVIFDELHRLANFKSLQYKIAYQLSSRATYTFGLTGTFVKKSTLLHLFPQVKVVDLGRMLGYNFYAFRNRYFKKRYFDWVAKKNTQEKILNRISPIIISYTREECLDLPKRVWEKRLLKLSEEQKVLETKIYNDLKVEFAEGTLTVSNVLNRTMKLQQIYGGFVYTKKGGERTIHRIKDNPKLEALGDDIEETDGQLIVFHIFNEEACIIEEWLKKNKFSFSSLRGETQDKVGTYEEFFTNSKKKVLVANVACVMESYDLTNCCVSMYYSHPRSFDHREQSEGRTYRLGQKKPVLYLDYLMQNTVEEIICQRIEDVKELSREVWKFLQEKDL